VENFVKIVDKDISKCGKVGGKCEKCKGFYL